MLGSTLPMHCPVLAVKVSILDDYDDTLRTLDCFVRLEGHDVQIWTDHVQDVDVLAQRLGDTERRCFSGYRNSD